MVPGDLQIRAVLHRADPAVDRGGQGEQGGEAQEDLAPQHEVRVVGGHGPQEQGGPDAEHGDQDEAGDVGGLLLALLGQEGYLREGSAGRMLSHQGTASPGPAVR